MKRTIIAGLCLCAAASGLSDVIRGAYSYTYGDRESLVDARKVCKDLALREAIEAYAIFVQSSTEMDNYQLKEDMVQAISTGVLHDARIIDQQEQGRTIDMTVEADVSPDEVKTCMAQRIAAGKSQPADTVVVSSESDYLDQIAAYGTQLQAAESARDENRNAQADSLFAVSQAWLEHRRPPRQNHFLLLMHQCLVFRSQLATDLFRLKRSEALGRKVRTDINRRIVTRKAAELRAVMNQLLHARRITQKQQAVRQVWLDRSSDTLSQVRAMFNERKRR